MGKSIKSFKADGAKSNSTTETLAADSDVSMASGKSHENKTQFSSRTKIVSSKEISKENPSDAILNESRTGPAAANVTPTDVESVTSTPVALSGTSVKPTTTKTSLQQNEPVPSTSKASQQQMKRIRSTAERDSPTKIRRLTSDLNADGQSQASPETFPMEPQEPQKRPQKPPKRARRRTINTRTTRINYNTRSERPRQRRRRTSSRASRGRYAASPDASQCNLRRSSRNYKRLRRTLSARKTHSRPSRPRFHDNLRPQRSVHRSRSQTCINTSNEEREDSEETFIRYVIHQAQRGLKRQASRTRRARQRR